MDGLNAITVPYVRRVPHSKFGERSSTNLDNWDTLLPAAEFSYNHSKQKSTQEAPALQNFEDP